MVESHSQPRGLGDLLADFDKPGAAAAAATDPVLILARLLGGLSALHRQWSGTPAPSEALSQSLTVLGRGIEALRDAMSYLPAASRGGAAVQVTLARVAAERAGAHLDYAGVEDAAEAVERAARHLEAAFPALSEAWGIDLQALIPLPGAVLPALLRDAYLSEVAAILAPQP